MEKTILLVIPDHVGFPEAFEDNLNYLGFRVQTVVIPPASTFKYNNTFSRIINFVRKVFLNDKNYKKKLILKEINKKISIQLSKITPVQFALIIRPDLLPIELFKIIKSKSLKTIAYQWDGLDRYFGTRERINLTDSFFVFDSKDVNEKTSFTTNFYFNSIKTPSEIKEKNAYYMGSYLKERMEITYALKRALDKLEIKTNFNIVSNSKTVVRELMKNNINIATNIINYKKYLDELSSYNTIIDIQNPIHSGLSFRIFEGLGYEKKVITTNKEVKKFDFFHPNNYFIWDGENCDELEIFIKAPYHKMPDEIKYKYSFENWIKYVLGIDKHYKIDLPQN